MTKYKANEYALPIEVMPLEEDGYAVVTGLGLPVGPRLLKGVAPPLITEWGPFDTEEEAIRLKEQLIRHIEEWPVKKKKR
jgi:hypothetical protein